MFSEGVVSKRTKESVDEQRANSKFGGIYSKKRRLRGTNQGEKPANLLKVEDSISGADYFSQVLLLQNRETADNDLARVAESANSDDNDGGSETLQSKIQVAIDIFQNSTSREYLISL